MIIRKIDRETIPENRQEGELSLDNPMFDDMKESVQLMLVESVDGIESGTFENGVVTIKITVGLIPDEVTDGNYKEYPFSRLSVGYKANLAQRRKYEAKGTAEQDAEIARDGQGYYLKVADNPKTRMEL